MRYSRDSWSIGAADVVDDLRLPSIGADLRKPAMSAHSPAPDSPRQVWWASAIFWASSSVFAPSAIDRRARFAGIDEQRLPTPVT